MAVAARARTASSLLRGIAISRRPHLRSIHEGPDTIDELLDRHLAKKPSSSSSSAAALDDDAAEAEARRRLTSTRREALALYRDILRVTRLFEWPDDRGVPWRETLRANARREFEEARGERDPEVVARLLIGGRDAVQQALDRLAEASRRMVEAEEAKRRGGA
uniref:Complex 1 LYR protein domain-containing protein n=1 Tax=Leersia perrieri TaxID=77586 RepID=A0A0D9VP98_9ORYZ